MADFVGTMKTESIIHSTFNDSYFCVEKKKKERLKFKCRLMFVAVVDAMDITVFELCK